jgi:hypothetical protein
LLSLAALLAIGAGVLVMSIAFGLSKDKALYAA